MKKTVGFEGGADLILSEGRSAGPSMSPGSENHNDIEQFKTSNLAVTPKLPRKPIYKNHKEQRASHVELAPSSSISKPNYEGKFGVRGVVVWQTYGAACHSTAISEAIY
jgi:hypothetical protein